MVSWCLDGINQEVDQTLSTNDYFKGQPKVCVSHLENPGHLVSRGLGEANPESECFLGSEGTRATEQDGHRRRHMAQ